MDPHRYPDTLGGMVAHLGARMPPGTSPTELQRYAEVALEIHRLKRERNAILLGHNYMAPSLYLSVPDYTGDSLGLSRIAAASRADVIVFLGVRFMAETAKILNPNRLVLLPSPRGGCSLAEAVSGEDVRRLKKAYPQTPVVSYVNTYAEVKAETDICCTSSNAAAVVRHLLSEGHERVIFLPDEYLGRNVAAETGLPVILAAPGAEVPSDPPPASGPALIVWKGRCEVHEQFTRADVERARRDYPDVVVLSHPECHPDVVEASDFSGSTTAMIAYVRGLKGKRYLLLTECAMGDNIAAENPEAELLRLCSLRCPHMHEVTLEETLRALREDRFVVDVPPHIREAARASLERMIAIG